MKLFLTFFIFLVMNFLLNLWRLYRTKHYYKKFAHGEKHLLRFEAPISRLFEKAGTNELYGAGRYTFWEISRCIDIYGCKPRVEETFLRTIGTYQFKCMNTFNPIYILEFPLRLLDKGCRPHSKRAKIVISFFWWIFSIVAAYFLEKFLDWAFQEVFPAILDNRIK